MTLVGGLESADIDGLLELALLITTDPTLVSSGTDQLALAHEVLLRLR
jgi:hypothetical protein